MEPDGSDFEDFLSTLCGLTLLGQSSSLLPSTKFAEVFRRAGSWQKLSNCLREDPRGNLAREVIEAARTGSSAFFRSPHYAFQYFSSYLDETPGEVRIWSAGCSTGQEAYSFAMLASKRGRSNVRILGTDISQRDIEFAKAGRYEPKDLQVGEYAYFDILKDCVPDGVVSDEVKASCEFRQHNLADFVSEGEFAEEPFDIVSIRNVLMYFRSEDALKIISRISHDYLKPGGYLFIGGCDGVYGISGLEATDDQCFRKNLD